MNHLLMALFITFLIKPSWASVTCAPASCTPACDSSCTYQTCSASGSNPVSFNQLPFTYSAPPDACQDDLNGQVIRQLPSQQLPGVNQLPVNTTKSYLRCQTQTNYGPPCPP